MYAHSNESIDDFKKIAEIADACHYYSVLLTYDSLLSDVWIKCANFSDTLFYFKI
jgi:hypothetical protein